jgi:hypothetical protein
VSWSTGGAYIQDVGNNGLFGPQYAAGGNGTQTDDDKIWLKTASGSLNLALGVPQTALVNPLVFEVGQTGDEGTDESYDLKTTFSMARDMTVNGVTHSLVSPMTHDSGWFSDTLTVHIGSAVEFDVGAYAITVTPLGGGTSPLGAETTLVGYGGPLDSQVYAEFEATELGGLGASVPEPTGIVALLGIGGMGLVGLALRRRKAA